MKVKTLFSIILQLSLPYIGYLIMEFAHSKYVEADRKYTPLIEEAIQCFQIDATIYQEAEIKELYRQRANNREPYMLLMILGGIVATLFFLTDVAGNVFKAIWNFEIFPTKEKRTKEQTKERIVQELNKMFVDIPPQHIDTLKKIVIEIEGL